MAHRLCYQDSYGRVHRARAEHSLGGLPAAPFAKFLMILAVLVVLASFAPLTSGSARPRPRAGLGLTLPAPRLVLATAASLSGRLCRVWLCCDATLWQCHFATVP